MSVEQPTNGSESQSNSAKTIASEETMSGREPGHKYREVRVLEADDNDGDAYQFLVLAAGRLDEATDGTVVKTTEQESSIPFGSADTIDTLVDALETLADLASDIDGDTVEIPENQGSAVIAEVDVLVPDEPGRKYRDVQLRVRDTQDGTRIQYLQFREGYRHRGRAFTGANEGEMVEVKGNPTRRLNFGSPDGIPYLLDALDTISTADE